MSLTSIRDEAYVVDLLKNAGKVAKHAGRVGIQPKDLQISKRVSNADVKVVSTFSNAPVIEYNTDIQKVLKQLRPDMKLSLDAKSQLSFIITKVASAIIISANGLAMLSNDATLGVKHIEAAIKEVIPGELANHSVSEGRKTFAPEFKPYFSIGKTRTLLTGCKTLQKVGSRVQKSGCNRRISRETPIYLAAVLEYICAEIIELSTNSARVNIISAHDLKVAIEKDDELYDLKQKLNFEILI